jgi:hypothetical protein
MSPTPLGGVMLTELGSLAAFVTTFANHVPESLSPVGLPAKPVPPHAVKPVALAGVVVAL